MLYTHCLFNKVPKKPPADVRSVIKVSKKQLVVMLKVKLSGGCCWRLTVL